ncbi:hypothetical protein A4X09_0g6874 [Tilletia walkeri]|uniref:Pyridoxamine kinase/Phosphomethylpyrimidine kinase domain-containing protein n=1 Tax=Tilletia walkeri TaxID=117179 RepID=A0A8X7N461_9BASI|nr:hypothetical protein A4X09_0g6874 [Tilletia walkeri]
MVGVLANKDIVFQVTSSLKAPSSNRTPILLDPVMVSTSGSMLRPHEAVQALISEVFPRCTVVTPNAPEAIEILKHDSQGEDQEANSKELGRIAARISAQGSDRSSTILKALAVLEDAEFIALLGLDASSLKGGHAPTDRSDFDFLFGLENDDQDDAKKWSFASPYVEWDSAARQEPSTSSGLVYRIGSVDVVRMDHRPWSIALDRWAEKETSDDQPDSGSVVVDVLYQSQPGPGQSKRTMFVSKHSPSTSTRGTGCTLSSALATFLATRISTQEI